MNSHTSYRVPFLVPTATKQSWYFMIGASLFAIGSAVTIWNLGSPDITNWLCFIGAWFFTIAGLFQTVLSGDVTVAVEYPPGKMFRAEWLAASTQSVGTVLFNVSTTAALTARSISAEKHYVWNPDAGGSVAFLISAMFVYAAYKGARHTLWEPKQSGWWAAHINMLGCIAFAFSAVGAFVLNDGSPESAVVANWGTFIGAICFFLASAIVLPQLAWNKHATAQKHATARTP